ncbi:hypothetical protein JCGZ_02426 [Jatropha curcas]|uniref:Uncharacterized protein n=1 Tax=Jatropha curcas TaxID=180498 RepID=A0A067LPZ1_JATCU|nr:hypothetical protein JCGZ_02426 [Jatropha curcas]
MMRIGCKALEELRSVFKAFEVLRSVFKAFEVLRSAFKAFGVLAMLKLVFEAFGDYWCSGRCLRLRVFEGAQLRLLVVLRSMFKAKVLMVLRSMFEALYRGDVLGLGA